MTTRRTVMKAVLIGLFLFLSGCHELPHKPTQRLIRAPEAPSVVCPHPAQVKTWHILLLLIDRSGSVLDAQNRDTRPITEAGNLVRWLPPATLVLGRYISEQSYRDSEIFLSDAIPEEPTPANCQVTNPFDYHQKRQCQREELRYKAQLHCLDEARARIAAALQNLTLAPAPRTDLWGGIAAASEVLSAYPTSSRVVLMYSDLHDTVGARLPSDLPGLNGVEVIARTSRSEGPAEAAQRLSVVSERLAKWGAKFHALPLEVPMTVNDIFHQQQIAERR